MFKNVSVPKKIGFGFTVILVFLSVVAAVALFGIGGIVRNAGDVITSTGLQGQMLQREIDHLNWASSVSESITTPEKSGQKLEVQTDPHKCAFGGWYYSDERKQAEKILPTLKPIFASIEEPHKELHESAIEINNNIRQHDKVMDIYVKQTVPRLHEVQKLLGNVRETAKQELITDEQMLLAARNTKIAVTVLGGVIIVLGAALALAIVRAIVGPMRRIIENLNTGAGQMSSAARQIAGSSQALAEGAAEQASSLEETSASIDEMTSMTRQNAENADQADRLAREARRSAEIGNQATANMAEAMKQISTSSDQTSKIIKTIDEIAFQTNLLALNAAVEAARAGEAGKGFAVVADEVRNLAQRASEAARNTSGLIEDSVRSTGEGVKIAESVAKALVEITGSAVKVSDLVAEIAAASKEQAQGLGQVSKAVSEMDRITQSNASSSEESASAAEELNSQAEAVNAMVGEMVSMMGLSQQTSSNNTFTAKKNGAPEWNGNGMHVAQRDFDSSASHEELARRVAFKYGGATQGKDRNGNANGNKAAAAIAATRKPEELIPLHDPDTFSEF